MWQYVRALDTENADAYAAVYTPDGKFGTGANAVKGREALKKMINDLRQRAAESEGKSGEKRPAMYHVIANSYLEFLDKDHARLEALLEDCVRRWRAEGAGACGRCGAGSRRTRALQRTVAYQGTRRRTEVMTPRA